MTNLEMWALVVGFFSPVVLSVIQQPTWPQWARALVTFVFSVVVGGATAWFQNEFNGKDIVTTVLIVLVAAISTYKGLWQPTNVAPAIESVTSGRHAKHAA